MTEGGRDGRLLCSGPHKNCALTKAAFALVSILAASLAHAQVSTGESRRPAPSTYVGAVAGPTEVPQKMTTDSAQMMSRTPEWANDGITQVQVAFANFACCAGGIDSGPRNSPKGVTTVTASIEYPSGACAPLTFSGGAPGTAPTGGVLISDMATLPTPIPKGAQFWVREYTAVTGGSDTPIDFDPGHLNKAAGEQTALGTSVSDYTSSCAPPTAWTEPPYSLPRKPLAILGPTRRPSICLVGDSSIYGLGDNATGAYKPGTHYGYIDRWVGRVFGTINLGVSADSLKSTLLLGGYVNRGSLLKYCTHVVENYGANDINYFSYSAAKIEEDIARFIHFHDTNHRMYWYYTTMYPRSTVPDNLNRFLDSSPHGDNPAQKETQRQQFNADLRAGRVTAFDALLDPDAIAEQGPYTVNLPGRQSYAAYQGWFVTKADTGYSQQISGDGAHFNAAGTTLLDTVFSSAQDATPGVNNPFALFCRDKAGADRC